MERVCISLLCVFIIFSGVLSSPTPIQTNVDPSCPPFGCIVDTSLCFCGVKQTPEDRCCAATCAPCGPDFNVKPWLTFDWSSLNFTALVLPPIGRK